MEWLMWLRNTQVWCWLCDHKYYTVQENLIFFSLDREQTDVKLFVLSVLEVISVFNDLILVSGIKEKKKSLFITLVCKSCYLFPSWWCSFRNKSVLHSWISFQL